MMQLDMWGISCFLLHIIQVDRLIDCFKMWPVLFIVSCLTYNGLSDCCVLILFFASFASLFLPSLLLLSLSQTHMHTYTYTHLLSDFEHFVGQPLSWVWLFATPVDCSTPGFPALHYLLQFAQTHVHLVGDAIQPSHPLSPPSLPAPNLSQHQGLFQWVSSLPQVAKVLELQLQHQSFNCIFSVDFL